MLTTNLYRKFFGIGNGVEAKKQQSTLAFHSPLKSDKQGKKARKGAGPNEEAKQDVVEETKMINGIGEDEASSMEDDGGCENVKAEIEQVGIAGPWKLSGPNKELTIRSGRSGGEVRNNILTAKEESSTKP